MKLLLQDVRYSLRLLLKSPGFTIVAILTLSLGIGANAVVFSIMNAFILHPLNLPEGESLWQLERGSDKIGSQSYPDYRDLRDRNRSFDGLAAYNIAQVGLDVGEDTSRAWVELASGNYFDVLHLQPTIGRFFHDSDEHGPNSAPYIVLSHGYWHVHFQDDPSVVGRIVQVNKHPFTIIGVCPRDFHGSLVFFAPDFFVPIVNRPQVEGKDEMEERGKHWVFQVLGHLKRGVTPEQAVADLNSIGANLEKSYPKDDSGMRFTLARPGLYGDFLGPPVRAFLTGLMLLSGLILLAACANLGSLFAARAADRSREVALRLALGSSRKLILKQLFTEALLISMVGGIVGLLGSFVLLHGLSAWQPFPRFPIHVPVNPDTNVYRVALLLSLASAFLFGAVPVRQLLRTNPHEVIKAGSATRAGRRFTIRDVLLTGQIAICAVLVTSSLVAVRGLVRSLHSSFGFEAQNATLVDTELSMAGYTSDNIAAMQKRMIAALEPIPGVESVGLIDMPPLYTGSLRSLIYTDKTTDMRTVNSVANALTYKISPEYFRAAGTGLLGGRSLTWHDDNNVPPVSVVNQEFALKVFGSVSSAIGGYYKIRDGTRIQVVGVVEQGKYTSVTEDPQPAMFLPFLLSPSSETWLVVRSNRDPKQLGQVIRTRLRELDQALPVYVQAWTKELDFTLFPSNMATVSLGVLGLMGAMLSVTGIFGMAAYSVSKRLRELGVRIAIGALPKQVLQAALGRAFKLLAIGSIAGLLLGILASRVLAFIVYSATPRDPLVLGGVVLAMGLLGLVATWIPARRALSIDPLILMREQ